MMRTFDNIIYKRHHLVMDETKVMEALRIIQKTCNRLFTQIQIDMAVGSCGWKNSTMWYINLSGCTNDHHVCFSSNCYGSNSALLE